MFTTNLPKVDSKRPGKLLTTTSLTTQVNQIRDMESLLSLSFDYLSSYDGVKIRKGLRQLEGLLAQICLSTTPTDRRSSVISNGASKQTAKQLSSLKDDPAFREFFKLQEGFEWNGTSADPPSRPSTAMLIVMLQSQSDSYHAWSASFPRHPTARTTSSSCPRWSSCKAPSSSTLPPAPSSVAKST